MKIATFNKLLMSSSGDAAIKTRPDLATNHALRRHDLGFVFVQELGGLDVFVQGAGFIVSFGLCLRPE